MTRQKRVKVLAIAVSVACVCCRVAGGEQEVSYLQQIRPILSDKCFTCHGPDEQSRAADLRLDTQEDAHLDRGGYAAVVAGRPADSELMVRVEAADEDLRMPPPSSGKELSAAEIELLRQWIAEGAKYEAHWSFSRIQRPHLPDAPLPQDDREQWSEHPIDRFVLARLHAAGLTPSPPADRYALVRRVYLDLIGLPPTVEEADSFVRDDSPTAYEDLVDRLLASPHYGERWARRWLDLARYADTKGYEKDQPRTMWPYRDWVIDAINADMPFDRFTIEQLAGDMLAEPSRSQLVATGFHRNTMTNEEGGIDPQEFRYLSVVDRVATTGSTWLGLTVGCAQCHTHKYDPITHTDYFRLFALFNNADEVEIELPSDVDQKREQLLADIERATVQLAEKFPASAGGDAPASSDERHAAASKAFEEWIARERQVLVNWTVAQPKRVESNLPTTEVLADHSVLVSGDVTKGDTFRVSMRPTQPITAIRIEALPHPSLPNSGPGRQEILDDKGGGKGNFFLSEVTAQLFTEGETGDAEKQPLGWQAAYASFVPAGLDANHAIDGRSDTGWTVYGNERKRNCLVLNFQEPVTVGDNQDLVVVLRHDSFYPASLGRFRISVTSDPPPARADGHSDEVIAALRKDAADQTPTEKALLWDRFLQVTPELAAAREEIASLERSLPPRLTALVFDERGKDARVTRRHHRGEYLKPKEALTGGVPAFLTGKSENEVDDRLEFAEWLVSRENPLTARVAVNRWWEAFFGTGLVKTSADFGLQGEFPSHPELLDWLAAELMESGWSRKHLHRLIVTSETYQQSSDVDDRSLALDPENRLLSRAPRIRMAGEIVRDIVLRSSGLLSEIIGGPSVFPPQPAGITEAAYGPLAWKVSTGDDRYRRGLYTFAKRTAPYAAFGLFDCPSGEVCVPQRDRSNTPLQSLNLLNDEVVSEAARNLALSSFDPSLPADEIANRMLRSCITRPGTSYEIAAIVEFYDAQLGRLATGDLQALRVLNSGPTVQWNFSHDAAGWRPQNDVTLCNTEEGLLVESTGDDPFLSCAVDAPAGPYVLEVTAKFDEADHGEVFWTTESEPQESADRRRAFPVIAGEWHTYEIALDAAGPLKSLRLDLGTDPGLAQIQTIVLRYGDGLIVVPEELDEHKLAAWHLVARVLLNLDETITKP